MRDTLTALFLSGVLALCIMQVFRAGYLYWSSIRGSTQGSPLDVCLDLNPQVLRNLQSLQCGAWARGPWGESVYLNTENGRLYAYRDQAGFAGVRQDWWREVVLHREVSGGRPELSHRGPEFKRNVGYGLGGPQDMTPFRRITQSQLRYIRVQLLTQEQPMPEEGSPA